MKAEPLLTALAAGIAIASAQRVVANAFATAGIDTPQLDARLLTAAAANETPESLLLASMRPLSQEEVSRLASFAARRLRHEPVSRILGRRAFYGRDFKVTPDTLDPRPDTETLVDLALDLLRSMAPRTPQPLIADIGTGTGAILLTLLAEFQGARGVGTDISAAALDVARQNACDLGVDGRVSWRLGRSLEPLDSMVDLLISNPPYIPSGDIPTLDPEVRTYDPSLALDGGADGLSIVREIVAEAAFHVRPAGWCVLEFGVGQAGLVVQCIEKSCKIDISRRDVRVMRDLGGHERCVAWQPHI